MALWRRHRPIAWSGRCVLALGASRIPPWLCLRVRFLVWSHRDITHFWGDLRRLERHALEVVRHVVVVLHLRIVGVHCTARRSLILLSWPSVLCLLILRHHTLIGVAKCRTRGGVWIHAGVLRVRS